MSERMKQLQPELDKNPNVLAVDVGFKPKLVVIEEYISLISSLDKKQSYKDSFRKCTIQYFDCYFWNWCRHTKCS